MRVRKTLRQHQGLQSWEGRWARTCSPVGLYLVIDFTVLVLSSGSSIFISWLIQNRSLSFPPIMGPTFHNTRFKWSMWRGCVVCRKKNDHHWSGPFPGGDRVRNNQRNMWPLSQGQWTKRYVGMTQVNWNSFQVPPKRIWWTGRGYLLSFQRRKDQTALSRDSGPGLKNHWG